METERKLILDVGRICEELGVDMDYIETVVKKGGGTEPGAKETEKKEEDDEDHNRKDADKEKKHSQETGQDQEKDQDQGQEREQDQDQDQGQNQDRVQGNCCADTGKGSLSLPPGSHYRFSDFMEGVGRSGVGVELTSIGT
ncbi:hypothetical protein [Paenibacillus sp. UNC499MF]|uniref:hypothetical protein n=1 Tax=Paenibacillus sp. UNC499MF TaxID=1502751 RepID=UPI00089FA801|nr:hypothetical protein [Paenibacillus sp. UNC499MF]SEF92490.1 hypothetical protein SAMN02799616_01473 [Paenibacillus sp. UNC499MF]